MEMWVDGLAADPLTAAAKFHAEVLPWVDRQIEAARSVGGDEASHLTLVFSPAGHTHRGWRLAAVQSLARLHAPLRVNAIASDDETAIAAAMRYLAGAPGVTGQYLPLDGTGAD